MSLTDWFKKVEKDDVASCSVTGVRSRIAVTEMTHIEVRRAYIAQLPPGCFQ